MYSLAGSSAFLDFDTDVEEPPGSLEDHLAACQDKLKVVTERLEAANLKLLGRFYLLGLGFKI